MVPGSSSTSCKCEPGSDLEANVALGRNAQRPGSPTVSQHPHVDRIPMDLCHVGARLPPGDDGTTKRPKTGTWWDQRTSSRLGSRRVWSRNAFSNQERFHRSGDRVASNKNKEQVMWSQAMQFMFLIERTRILQQIARKMKDPRGYTTSKKQLHAQGANSTNHG
eukprot:Gb_02230 [translate_table: standard]